MAQETTGSNGAAAADVEMVEANELRRRSKPGDRARRDGEGAVPAEEEEAAVSVERAFADQRVPSWREQLTVRAFVVSFFLAVMFSVIVMKLNLTIGVIPSLNVSAGLGTSIYAPVRFACAPEAVVLELVPVGYP
jgi:hypothetical protein